MDTALKTNGITATAKVNTDYTLPTALEEMTDLLQSHSNINVVFAVGRDVATGVVDALKAAGKKAGQVKIFDVGGASTDVTLIKEGWLTMTVPYFPVTALDAAVANLIDAFGGHQGPRAVPGLVEGTPSSPFEVDKSTLSKYHAQY
jgi:ABC-type sugar transport system substrate-binding protein